MSRETFADDGRIARRTALKKIGIVGTAGVVAGLGVTAAASGVVRAGNLSPEVFTAADVELSSQGGAIEDVWLRPELVYTYEDLAEAAEKVAFTIEISDGIENGKGSGEWTTLGSETDDDPPDGKKGEGEYDFEETLSIFDDGPFERPDFRGESDAPGWKIEVEDIGVKLNAKLSTVGTNYYEDTKTAYFNVYNEKDGDDSSSGITYNFEAGGKAGTGGEAAGN